MPGQPEFEEYLRGLRTWGRWGPDDEIGSINHITPASILAAVAEVRIGLALSLSREIPTAPADNNPHPADHRTTSWHRGTNGVAVDYVGLGYHGRATTHLDALCHLWNVDGMWGGRDPKAEIGEDGARSCGVEGLRNGIISRAVLLDVAGGRAEGFVEYGSPVTGSELAAVAEGVDLRPGDALVVHSGRDAWEARHGRGWGSAGPYPGLDESCLEFFAKADPSVLVWDMMDETPNRFGTPHLPHAALYTQGLALLDNALLSPLARRCGEFERRTFLLFVAPLVVVGGTGSPVNPIAVL